MIAWRARRPLRVASSRACCSSISCSSIFCFAVASSVFVS
jgi:hypothetical protein